MFNCTINRKCDGGSKKNENSVTESTVEKHNPSGCLPMTQHVNNIQDYTDIQPFLRAKYRHLCYIFNRLVSTYS